MKPSARMTFDAVSAVVAVTRTAGVDELIPRLPPLGFGLATTFDVTGPVLSIVSVISATVPQLPAWSCARIRTVCGTASASAFTVAAAMVASRLTVTAGATTVMGVAAPPSMVYSAAVTFDPPVATSEPVACSATLTEPLVGLGARLSPVDAGP